jgi:hypothetical protein
MGRWVAAGLVLAALLGGLVLLGGEDSPGVELADAAQRIEGESMRQRVTMRYGDATGRYEISGEGVVAADSSRGKFDMDVTMKDEALTFRMLMRGIGDEFWFRYPRLERRMPRGKPWVHAVDKSTAPTTLTPSEFAEFLSDADEVSEVGEERVLGKMTTHYQGMIDLEDLVDEIGGETEERFERALEASDFPDDKRPGLSIEAYISEDGLPVRLRIWGGESDDNSFDMTTDILEYGVPVEVEEPPPSQVIEEAEFNRLTGG